MRRFFYVERLWPFFPGLFRPPRFLLARKPRDVAAHAIKELYPDGVPAALRPRDVIYAVGKWCEGEKEDCPSDRTILRAAADAKLSSEG
jgi:hypothetical protein